MRKQKQRKWILESAGGEDRISSLSDELLHKIMCFMNTKYAVQTCVLSKRWQSVWKSLPYLDLDEKTFPFKGHHPGKGKGMIISFKNFISRVLSRRHESNLVQVRVKFFFATPNPVMVARLMAYAVDHNVQQLTILSKCLFDRNFILPERFYTCQSLAALHLFETVKFPKFLSLPALQSLHFHMVSEGFLNPRTFSGCPNLQTLKLDDICLDRADKTLFINAPSLKRLKLSFLPYRENYRRNGCNVVIDAPRLASFQYCGYAPIVHSSKELASIDDVYFDIYNKYDEIFICEDRNVDDIYIDICPEHILRLISTFKEFRHAKSLTLSLDTAEVLATFPSLLDENQSPFSNLKYLKINLGWRAYDKADIPGCVLNFFVNSSTKFKLYEQSIQHLRDDESWHL